MNDKVVDIRSARGKKRSPEMYAVGTVLCLNCKHKWEEESDVEHTWFTCPNCSLIRGARLGPFARVDEGHFTCECGSQLFNISEKGAYCPNCGGTHEDYLADMRK
jgi:Zn finger protein HypA/HybF involved in hydrogenase expression